MPSPTDIAGRRELFVDDFLLDTLTGATLKLHGPERREVSLVHDAPWEGNTCGYNTTFRDGDVVRMYYRGSHHDPDSGKNTNDAVACYAESEDGIQWRKPELRIHAFEGSAANNIVLNDKGTHNFAPFKDTNPDCGPSARYKGLGRGLVRDVDIKKLYAFASPDGLNWSLLHDEPLELEGAFDSQNLAFWDANVGKYRMYFRDFREPERVRDIKTSLSDDFIHWSPGEWLAYPGSPDEHLYTNQVQPYYRAPHLYFGFPTRFIKERGEITEGLFMSSRDGLSFRRWGEAIIRPGLDPGKWGNRCNYTWCGLVETPTDCPGAPMELSIYTDEAYYTGNAVRTRRHVYRIDGFVSINAPLSGGQAVTRPIVFEGAALSLNMSTSAAGAIRVEIQDAEGHPIDGFAHDDCPAIFGDRLDHTVTWSGGSDVSRLAGKPVRLRFTLEDADVYAMQFLPIAG